MFGLLQSVELFLELQFKFLHFALHQLVQSLLGFLDLRLSLNNFLHLNRLLNFLQLAKCNSLAAYILIGSLLNLLISI